MASVLEGQDTEMKSHLPDAPDQDLPPFAAAASENAAEAWISRSVILAVCAAFAWYTWGHWGNFQIDNGRELYVPAEIAKGKLLFRDLWYMYGPLAPYLKAGLFRIFGVHLNVLYGLGLALTAGCALLTYEITLQFRLGPVGNAVPSIFFLTESFYPFIRNFVFPYSYAASLGTFWGVACLYFVVRHAASRRIVHLGMASFMCCLAVLTKQEFGMACLALVGFEIAGSYWIRRSRPEAARSIAVFAAALIPAVAVYGWFVWKLSARLIFFENWISTPGTYFMRTYGKITIPFQGLRFIPKELSTSILGAILALVLWSLLARWSVGAIKKLRLNTLTSIAASTMLILTPLGIATYIHLMAYSNGRLNPIRPWSFVVVPISESLFPNGVFFLMIAFTLRALWNLVKGSDHVAALQQAGLGMYACLAALRQMMELRPTIYDTPVFFNGPAFLVYALIVTEIYRWAGRSLDGKYREYMVGSMWLSVTIMIVIQFCPNPDILPTKLTTDEGSFYTRPDVAALFPQIISFMKSHTVNGKDILVVPEPPSLYVFANMEAPSRWYSLVPGYIAPEQEQQYMDELSAKHVRYVLIFNRRFTEYRVAGFANGGYNPRIRDWIFANYNKVGQFGPMAGAEPPPVIVWLYERKDLHAGD